MKKYILMGAFCVSCSVYTMRMTGIARFLSQKSLLIPQKIGVDPRILLQRFIDDKVEHCQLPAGAFKRGEREALFDIMNNVDRVNISKEELVAFAIEGQKKAEDVFDLHLQKHLTSEQSYTYKANVDFRNSSKYHEWDEKKKQQYFNDFKKMQTHLLMPEQLEDVRRAEKRYLISRGVYTYLYVHASGYPVPITFYL